MNLAPPGADPEAVAPEKYQKAEQPENRRLAIEHLDFGAGDIKGQDQGRSGRICDAQGKQGFAIFLDIAPALGLAFRKSGDFDIALEVGKAEENEYRECQQP